MCQYVVHVCIDAKITHGHGHARVEIGCLSTPMTFTAHAGDDRPN